MKSRRHRNMRRKVSRRNKKGGEFNSYNTSIQSNSCDINSISSIQGSNALHTKYQQCCPKTTFGQKNSSPYCKQLDLNFQAALKGENGTDDYERESEVPQPQLSKVQYDVASAQKKPWYKFWGGKTNKRRGNKKGSRKHRRK